MIRNFSRMTKVILLIGLLVCVGCASATSANSGDRSQKAEKTGAPHSDDGSWFAQGRGTKTIDFDLPSGDYEICVSAFLRHNVFPTHFSVWAVQNGSEELVLNSVVGAVHAIAPLTVTAGPVVVLIDNKNDSGIWAVTITDRCPAVR